MDFVGNSDLQVQEILKTLGLSKIEELFQTIPHEIRESAPSEDDGLSEWEGKTLMESIAEKNLYHKMTTYLGAGAYDHYIPAVTDAIIQKSGFLTSYTPYQAEVSQGTLQSTFEFQSAVVALTGLDVANSGVYDAAGALAEAVLMALRYHKKKKKILVAGSIHPHYLGVLKQYLSNHAIEIVEIPLDNEHTLDEKKVLECLTDEYAAIAIQSPNFFGFLEPTKKIFSEAKKKNVTCILSANPLSYGLLSSANEQGTDIATGDMQVFGNPLQFGGPYIGYMATSNAFLRQMPGRIVGRTLDCDGKDGYVLTLQAREQHIRREKATSNICTSQSLCALASLVTILWYGKEGIHALALTNYQRAHYLHDQLVKIGWEAVSTEPFFNEFTIKAPKSTDLVLEKFRKHMVEPGLRLKRFFKDKDEHLLINVTEKKSLDHLNQFIEIAKEVL